MVMFLISLKAIDGLRSVYALSGDVRSLYLPRLEMIIRGLQERGRCACFDMENVTSLEAGVILFFVEGAGRETPLISPPEPLSSIRESSARRPVNRRSSEARPVD